MSKNLEEIINQKFGETYGPKIKKALKDGLEANDTEEQLKKRLLGAIIDPTQVNQEQANAVFDLVIVAEWITFRSL
ncbi:MAG: hypothetical protein ACFFA4_06555 [Promethearchaeota archaeon]